ncbi:MAG TPA: hypothetical protein VGK54_02065, partial [Chloroflexota bacterium]
GILAVHIKEEKARSAYLERAKRIELAKAGARAKTPEIVAAILAGKMRIEDVQDRADLTHIEDDLMLAGQGEFEDPAHEVLGKTDVGIVVIREIWQRELRALAEGQPLTQWSGWEDIIVTDVGSRELTSVLEEK